MVMVVSEDDVNGMATAELFCRQLPINPSNTSRDAAFSSSRHPFVNRQKTLRHIYHKGSHRYPRLFRKIDISDRRVRLDFEDEDGSAIPNTPWDSFSVKSSPLLIQRLGDRRRHVIDSLLEHGVNSGEPRSLDAQAWTIDEVPGPDVTDKKTVLSFAHMAANAYISIPRKGDWIDIGSGFNYTEDFGWEDDGLRGHIFADTENKTVVIGLKGTSLWFFDAPETTDNDRLNDNLFGSCCCGQGGQYSWKQVCECQSSAYTCNSTCLVRSLREKSSYYHAARHIYHNVTALYPNATIWLTGHSLGGVVSSLLGATYGLPTLTFEAFPDALAARRLGLPTPPGHAIGEFARRHYTGTFHFGHTADPIYVGNCNSFDSPCTIAGYAFQSKCHTGYNCTYDTVGDLGWRVSIGTHRITSVIKDVIEAYDSVPVCTQDVDCTDCSEWSFFTGNATKSPVNSTNTVSDARVVGLQRCVYDYEFFHIA
ncbi:alpha/beta-hydrolase [Aureobasidium sp. EXF-10727]|nr:alpha/beta-hydrolase [Aureobasidium sp. EXF-10727]